MATTVTATINVPDVITMKHWRMYIEATNKYQTPRLERKEFVTGLEAQFVGACAVLNAGLGFTLSLPPELAYVADVVKRGIPDESVDLNIIGFIAKGVGGGTHRYLKGDDRSRLTIVI